MTTPIRTILAALVLAALSPAAARAQDSGMQPSDTLPPPALLARDPAYHGRYLEAWTALGEREARYLAEPAFARTYLELAAVYASFLGRHDRAHALADRLRTPRQASEEEDAEARALLAGAAPLPALEAVAAAAEGHRAVFVNEAHHVPQHRAFTLRLLERLRAQGFRYLALEMVAPEDTALPRRGYPAAGVTGIYTDEPLGAELVRAARRLGYTLVAYDTAADCAPPEDAGPLFCANQREERQAAALAAVLEREPGARLVVHAGLAHVSEAARGEWVPMAVRFRERTGIDPLTVDQTVMTERSAPAHEDPAYRAALARGLVGDEPVALRGADGAFVVRGYAVDLQLWHPRTRLEDGRPHWLKLGGARRPVPAGALPAGRPVLVQAFHAAEGPDAVPADQVLVEAGDPAPVLILPPGDFRLRVVGVDGAAGGERRLRVGGRARKDGR